MRRRNKMILMSVACWMTAAFSVYAGLTGEEAHRRMLYPIVRINDAGSGTLIYSKENEEGTFSTYALTNFHVVENAVTIAEEWNSSLGRNEKIEKRATLTVEIFKYRDMSTAIGTLKVDAILVLYAKERDVALVKLSTQEKIEPIARLLPREKERDLHIFDETTAVGCALAWSPIPTNGMLSRLNMQIDSLPYHMSGAQIIYGNSGGAMFLSQTGELIGIPSRVPALGWSTPITHMGLFIPIGSVYEWLTREHYDFIWDDSKTEAECLAIREEEIKQQREKQ